MRARRLAALLAAFAVAGLGASQAPAAELADHRILVMLRLPPDHLRAGGDYGGAYGDRMSREARHRVAARLARAHGLTLEDEWPMPILGVDCFVMRVPEGQSLDGAARDLAREPSVAWSEPSHLYQGKSDTEPNDPLYRVQPATRAWRLGDLHQLATGRGVQVAVIDSQIERSHPDLAGQVATAQDFTGRRPVAAEAHGTGVAGVIVARADNGVGIVGVAPGARLMALRACWQVAGTAAAEEGTLCDSLSLAKALEYAIDHRAQVINLSLAGPSDTLLARLIDAAVAHHATVVAASDRALPGGGFPASHPGVIGVVAESLATPPPGAYSAPGRDVPTTEPGGRWYLVSGSSFAAAHVSGLFALLRQRDAAASTATALVAMRGAIDACASLVRVTGPCECGCSRSSPSAASRR
jgi:subtilisin family serine protease